MNRTSKFSVATSSACSLLGNTNTSRSRPVSRYRLGFNRIHSVSEYDDDDDDDDDDEEEEAEVVVVPVDDDVDI